MFRFAFLISYSANFTEGNLDGIRKVMGNQLECTCNRRNESLNLRGNRDNVR